VEEFSKAVAIKRTMMQVRQVKKGVGFADELVGGISQPHFPLKRPGNNSKKL
jgi:hypothetical protein